MITSVCIWKKFAFAGWVCCITIL